MEVEQGLPVYTKLSSTQPSLLCSMASSQVLPCSQAFPTLPAWPRLGSSYRGELFLKVPSLEALLTAPFLFIHSFTLPVPSPSLKAQRPQSVPLPLCPSALQFINSALLSLPGLHGHGVRLFQGELSNYLTCLRTPSSWGAKAQKQSWAGVSTVAMARRMLPRSPEFACLFAPPRVC